MMEKTRNKPPPVALNTVDMLRVASSQLHMGPQHVMHLAEKLYTQVCSAHGISSVEYVNGIHIIFNVSESIQILIF